MTQYKGKKKCECGNTFNYKDKDTTNMWLGGYVWVTCPKCGKSHIIN